MCNSPMKEELKLLTNRLELAKNRREAISLEAAQLDEEIPHLEALIGLYNKKPYDSIVEERRVTSRMLKAPKGSNKEAASDRRQASPKGLLIRTMQEVFTDATEGLSYKDLGKEMDKKMGYHVASNGIYTNLKKLREVEGTYRVVKNNNAYILAEYLKDSPDAVEKAM